MNKKKNKLILLKKRYYDYLDRKSRHIAYKLTKGSKVTPLILKYTAELYQAAKEERKFENKNFYTRYHAPISSELEFLIARTLFHFSNFKNLGWSIYLRKQEKKTAPDIRIDRNGKTIGIVEIKAKAGWIQSFFSSERAEKDRRRLESGKGDFNPDDLIKRMRSQLKKYEAVYKIKPEYVFLFLPTLRLVHRKKSQRKLKDYQMDFVKNSGLQKDNLILLSKNLNLDLSEPHTIKDCQPLNMFEKFVIKLKNTK